MLQIPTMVKKDSAAVAVELKALYSSKAKSLKRLSISAEKRFNSIDFKKIFGKDEHEFNLAIDELMGCLSDMIFFLPKNVEVKLKEQGIPKEVRQWLIPFKKINKEIVEINKIKGLYINPYSAIVYIQQHLIAKLINALLIFLKKKTNKIKSGYDYNLGHAELFKFFKKLNRCKKEGKVLHYKPGEATFHAQYIMTKYKYNMTDQEVQKLSLDASRGKTEKTLLNQLFYSIHKIEGYTFSDSEFCINVYDLFNVIEPGYFDSEKEFIHNPKFLSVKTYRLHKIKQLKDLIHTYY